MKAAWRWLTLAALLVVALVVAAVALAPRIVETDWARERVRRALEQRTGRDVTLGEMRVTAAGGIQIQGVIIHARPGEQPVAPLVQAEVVELDLNWWDLLHRELTLEALVLERPVLNIVRRPEGGYNFADLLRAEPAERAALRAERVPVLARDATLRYFDRRLGTVLVVQDANIEGTWTRAQTRFTLAGTLDEGDVRASVLVDTSREPSRVHIERFTVSGARLTDQARLLAPFFPLLGRELSQASGRLSFALRDVSFVGMRAGELRRTLSGGGQLELSDARIESNVVGSIYQALRAAPQGLDAVTRALAPEGDALALGDVTASFEIANGRIRLRPVRFEAEGVRFALSGSTGLGGSLAYELAVLNLEQLLRERGIEAPIVRHIEALPLSLTGTLAQPRVQLELDALLEQAAPKAAEELAPEALRRLFEELQRL